VAPRLRALLAVLAAVVVTLLIVWGIVVLFQGGGVENGPAR
jgi:hypothetical protein